MGVLQFLAMIVIKAFVGAIRKGTWTLRGCGLTVKRPQSRCSSSSACARTASKVLLAVKPMGGESTETWRTVLNDLIRRGLRRPEFLIVDGAPGLESAIAAIWDGVPGERCTVHKQRNMLAHALERLHDEISADYNDMMYAATRKEVETRRKAFIRKWRLKHRAVADSFQEAGDRLFTFTRLPPSQWESARTTKAYGFIDWDLPPSGFHAAVAATQLWLGEMPGDRSTKCSSGAHCCAAQADPIGADNRTARALPDTEIGGGLSSVTEPCHSPGQTTAGSKLLS